MVYTADYSFVHCLSSTTLNQLSLLDLQFNIFSPWDMSMQHSLWRIMFCWFSWSGWLVFCPRQMCLPYE